MVVFFLGCIWIPRDFLKKCVLQPPHLGAVLGLTKHWSSTWERMRWCPECRVQLVVAVFLFYDIPWISHICIYTCIAAKRRWGLTQWNQVTRGYPWGDFAEEKTKIVAKLAPKASGAPVREPRIDENTHKAHKLWCGRRVVAAMWGLWSGEMGTMIYKSNQDIAPHCSMIV